MTISCLRRYLLLEVIMATLVSVGQPAGHVEGPSKVTGQARYTADVALPGLLYGKCLRSPFSSCPNCVR